MGVPEAREHAAHAITMTDVWAVRVSLLVGVSVVLSVVGDPADHRALDAHRPEHREQVASWGVSGKRAMQRALETAREWGSYLVAQSKPRPGSRPPAGVDLARLQEAMARAGFDPRFRRTGGRAVEITLRAETNPARATTFSRMFSG